MDCVSTDKAPLVLACIGLGFVMFVLYWLIDSENRATQPQSLVFAGIMMGMMVTMIQQMAVLSTMAVHWEEPIRTILDLMRFIIFDIDIVQVGLFPN